MFTIALLVWWAVAGAQPYDIAGTDPDKVWQLPNTDGLKSEVIMVGGRSVYQIRRNMGLARPDEVIIQTTP